MKTKQDGIKFLKAKLALIKTGMLTTYTKADGFDSRPMGTADVDADGNIWFFTNKFSAKVKEISADNQVSLTYEDQGHNTYLSIRGIAKVVDDKEKMKKCWNPFIQAFFPEGLNDPKLTMLKVETTELEYWESNSSSLVLLFNMMKANILGEQFDAGAHGKLKL